MDEGMVAENNNIAEVAKCVLEDLLVRMGIEASVGPQAESDIVGNTPGRHLAFDVKGEDLGILIGRGGQTLTSLQFMVRLIVSHQTKNWAPC